MKNVMMDHALMLKVGKNLSGSTTPLAMKIRGIARETACNLKFKRYADNPELLEKSMANPQIRRPLAKAVCKQLTGMIGQDNQYYVDGKNALQGEKSMVAHFAPRRNRSRTIFIDFNPALGGAEISLDKSATFTRPNTQIAHAIICGGTLSRKVMRPPGKAAEMDPDIAMAALVDLLKKPEIAKELAHIQETSLIQTYVMVNRMRRPLMAKKHDERPNPETLNELRALHAIADAIVSGIPYMKTIQGFINYIR